MSTWKPTRPNELPHNEYVLWQDVRLFLGLGAAASLSCILLDDVREWVGLTAGEIEYIKKLAEERGVALHVNE